MVMGIVPVKPQELVRFEEGNNSDFHDVQEDTGHSPEPLEETPNLNINTLGSGEFHGGYGSASLRECYIDWQHRRLPPLLPSTLGKVQDLTFWNDQPAAKQGKY